MAQMIPDLFPFKTALVYLTGVLEWLFAAGLLVPKTKTITGWALIAFLLAVLPANINAAMENINFRTGASDGYGVDYLWFRIPLQLFFIAWVYFSAIKRYKSPSNDNANCHFPNG